MAEVKCVEPSMVGAVPGSDYVCMVKPEDSLVFPHVDVCMATAWITKRNWHMIGGHVPGQWDTDSAVDPSGSAMRVFTLMDRKWSERSVDLIIALGDPSAPSMPGWTDTIRTLVRNLAPSSYLILWKDTPGGADLKIDGPTKKLTLFSSRTGALILEKNLDEIQKEEKPIKYDAPVLFKTIQSWKSQFRDEPFKGLEPFHTSCRLDEQTRIKNLFKDIFDHHGSCTDILLPINSGLEGQATFLFSDGEKVVFHVELAQHQTFKDRYQITNVTSMFRRYGNST